jgi:hypothetical protein
MKTTDEIRNALIASITTDTAACFASGLRTMALGPAKNPYYLRDMKAGDLLDENYEDSDRAPLTGLYIQKPGETSWTFLTDEMEQPGMTPVIDALMNAYTTRILVDIQKSTAETYLSRLYRVKQIPKLINPADAVEVIPANNTLTRAHE